MSLATIVGFLVSMGLFLGSIAISTKNYWIFADLASFVMVVGGTLGATFIAYEPRYVFLSLKLILRIVMSPRIGRNVLKNEVGRVIRWAYTVQKNGIPALEQEAKKSTAGDRFLKFGVDMVISGYSGAEVREIMNNTIDTTFGRNTVQVDILKNMASAAKGLAVALLTTLYGVLFARIILLPAATKILQREQIIRFRNYLVAEGLALLADRKSPRYIQDKMNSFLDPSLHFNIDKMKG
ncbi:MAG: flagellar motor protein MotA [Rhodospirillales bacterium]|nr:flagellar motor protein MotA [Rhodospirillales bacterium]